MHCEKEKEIEQLNKDMYRGNGRRSVLSRLETHAAAIKELSENLEKMKIDYEVDIKNIKHNLDKLIKYQTQQETRDEMRIEVKADKKWFIALLVTLFISISTTALTLYQMF